MSRPWMRKRRSDPGLGPRLWGVTGAWLPAACGCRCRSACWWSSRRLPRRLRRSPPLLPRLLRELMFASSASMTSTPSLLPRLLCLVAITDRDPVLFFFFRRAARGGRWARHSGGRWGGGGVGEMVVVAQGETGTAAHRRQCFSPSPSVPSSSSPELLLPPPVPSLSALLLWYKYVSSPHPLLPMVDRPLAHITSSASRCSGAGRHSSPPSRHTSARAICRRGERVHPFPLVGGRP
jgi:hypothetical protein